MKRYLNKISLWLTDDRLEKAIGVIIFFGFMCKLLPTQWDISHGNFGDPFSTIAFFVCLYLCLTISLFMMFRRSGNLITYLLFLLSWGKVTDQFYSPYEWSLAEKLWDVFCVAVVIKEYLNAKKKHEDIGQK